MSSVIVVSPIIIATWPVIAHAITGVVTSVGFSVLREGDQEPSSERTATETAELEVPDSEVLNEVASEGQEEMVVERDGVIVRFNRDRRGALKLCVSGNRSKRQLQQLGEAAHGKHHPAVRVPQSDVGAGRSWCRGLSTRKSRPIGPSRFAYEPGRGGRIDG